MRWLTVKKPSGVRSRGLKQRNRDEQVYLTVRGIVSLKKLAEWTLPMSAILQCTKLMVLYNRENQQTHYGPCMKH